MDAENTNPVSEPPPSEPRMTLEVGVDLAKSISVAVADVSHYSWQHPTVTKTLQNTWRVVEKVLDDYGTVTLKVADNVLSCEGVALTPAEPEPALEHLLRHFARLSVTSLSFLEGLPEDELDAFLRAFAKDPDEIKVGGGMLSQLREAGVRFVRLNSPPARGAAKPRGHAAKPAVARAPATPRPAVVAARPARAAGLDAARCFAEDLRRRTSQPDWFFGLIFDDPAGLAQQFAALLTFAATELEPPERDQTINRLMQNVSNLCAAEALPMFHEDPAGQASCTGSLDTFAAAVGTKAGECEAELARHLLERVRDFVAGWADKAKAEIILDEYQHGGLASGAVDVRLSGLTPDAATRKRLATSVRELAAARKLDVGPLLAVVEEDFATAAKRRQERTRLSGPLVTRVLETLRQNLPQVPREAELVAAIEDLFCRQLEHQVQTETAQLRQHLAIGEEAVVTLAKCQTEIAQLRESEAAARARADAEAASRTHEEEEATRRQHAQSQATVQMVQEHEATLHLLAETEETLHRLEALIGHTPFGVVILNQEGRVSCLISSHPVTEFHRGEALPDVLLNVLKDLEFGMVVEFQSVQIVDVDKTADGVIHGLIFEHRHDDSQEAADRAIDAILAESQQERTPEEVISAFLAESEPGTTPQPDAPPAAPPPPAGESGT